MKSLKNVAKFKYLGMILKNKNYIHKETESRLNVGNACCHVG
jgi:hypothetical protein